MSEYLRIPKSIMPALQEAMHYIDQETDYFTVSVNGWTIEYDGTENKED